MSNNYQGNMRGPGQKNRGRGGRPNNMMGGGNPNNNRPRPPNRMQNFDSSGPSVKIRGNAYQVFERYIAMAREASSAGDRVAAENLYQHAEHYYRIMQANGEGQNNQMGQNRPMTPADTEMNPGDMDHDGQNPPAQPPAQPYQQQPHNPQQNNPQNNPQHNSQPHNPQNYQQQPQQPRHSSQPYSQPQPQQPQPQPVVQSQPQPQPQPEQPQPPAPGPETPQGS
jgi:hypothetical protein